jgi:hypothetical protein
MGDADGIDIKYIICFYQFRWWNRLIVNLIPANNQKFFLILLIKIKK